MAKVFTWPNLQGLFHFLTSNCPNPYIDGVDITINSADGTMTTATYFGQPDAHTNAVIINNVPSEWYNDLLKWIDDAEAYWGYLTHNITKKELYQALHARLNGKPILPTESIKYLGKKHIFGTSIDEKKEAAYDKWVENNVPGMKQIYEIDDLISKYQFKPAAQNYLSMLKQLKIWIQNGQISVAQAQARIDFIKNKLKEMHLDKQPDVPIDTPKSITKNEYHAVDVLPHPITTSTTTDNQPVVSTNKSTNSTTEPVVKIVETKSNDTDTMLKVLQTYLSLQALEQKTSSVKDTLSSYSMYILIIILAIIIVFGIYYIKVKR